MVFLEKKLRTFFYFQKNTIEKIIMPISVQTRQHNLFVYSNFEYVYRISLKEKRVFLTDTYMHIQGISENSNLLKNKLMDLSSKYEVRYALHPVSQVSNVQSSVSSDSFASTPNRFLPNDFTDYQDFLFVDIQCQKK
jgi:hypothetical protein